MKLLLLLILSFNFAYCGTQKTVAIFTYVTPLMQPWDPASIGLPGSEEAVVYLSQKLAELGYQVVVFGSAPQNSPYAHDNANPRYLSALPQKGEKFDVAISWRGHANLREFASKVYLWPHDVLNRYTPDLGYDDIFWLSEWQREQWCSVNPAFAKYKNIYGNGINPEQFNPVQERSNPYSCIYASNYGRGLEILLDIWPAVKEAYPKATLDIYYGWQHWGQLSPEKEAKLRQQVTQLLPLDVREHGLVSHAELNKAYEKSSIWTYPCILPETFCISALRAQFAGCVPVIHEFSALQETVRFGYKCRDPNHYCSLLMSAMERAEQITLAERKAAREFILNQFTWEALALKWKECFELDDFEHLKNASFRKINHSATSIKKSENGYLIFYPNYIVHYDQNFKKISQEESAEFCSDSKCVAFDGGSLELEKVDAAYDLHRFVINSDRHSKPFTFRHKGNERCIGMITDNAGQNLILLLCVEESSQLCFIPLDTVRSIIER